MNLGATYLQGGRCQFVVWAPFAEEVEVQLCGGGGFPVKESSTPMHDEDRRMQLEKKDCGYHEGIAERVFPGARYFYRLDGKKQRPDPASRYQPEGVHGASEVVDFPGFEERDANWRGIALEDYLTYEIHVGTYTREGTFDAIIPHLDQIKNLGVTALEIMPVAQFPGGRNWGYDGVYPFAVQSTYGGPAGLRRLVKACHARELAVVLDVVYNHLGPEGNYLGDYAPYFTRCYSTPWGSALNFDGKGSDEVVRFFIENALYWVRDFEIDALRLDAIHGIIDRNAQPFLKLLAEAVHEYARESGREIHLIAESDLNDVRFIQPANRGGYGLDAQWSDDFHHALHSLLTGERVGYYEDFGRLSQLRKSWDEGFVYSGQYSIHRNHRHGSGSREIPAKQFVVFSQNHDQVGNRMLGERLGALVCFESLKLSAAMVILSPYLPLLFMGEEWAETSPFQYFTSHSDAGLIEAVRRGRREEFSAFKWSGEIPDPQDEAVFERCKLNHGLAESGRGRTLWKFYRELIRLRRAEPALRNLSKTAMQADCDENTKILKIRRWRERSEFTFFANFGDEARTQPINRSEGSWKIRMDSAAAEWGGPKAGGEAGGESEVSGGLELSPRSFIAIQHLG
jgi:maltooligosyltrehalose trehalohydrolase